MTTNNRPCGNSECYISSDMAGTLTFGSGKLDFYGYWEKPCSVCARANEAAHPNEYPCWPFDETTRQTVIASLKEQGLA